MKKILFLALLVSLTILNSCSVDDNIADFQFEFIPVEGVEIPEEFNFGETYIINVMYKRPTTCHSFNNFQYIQGEDNLRTIAVINFVTSGNNCEALDNDVQTETFNFNVLDTEPYRFRFWQGRDDNGQDVYLVYDVPVIN